MSSLAPSNSRTALRWSAITPPGWMAEAAFAALTLLGTAIAFFETRGFSFYFDDWEFLLHRRGLSPSVLLAPHGPHLVVLPILIYKLLLKVFGGSYFPFRVLTALDMAGLAIGVGFVCRHLWGRWWGLVPVLLLVTLGCGSWPLLWSFEVEYAIADALGVIALLALALDWRHGRSLACALLLLALASGSQGVGFLVGAAVMVVLRGHWRRSSWVVLIPAVLYGLWYLKYGQQASETHLSQWRGTLPYVMTSLASTVSGVLGLGSPSNDLPPQLDPSFGQPIAVAAVIALVVALARGWRPPSLFWGATTAMVALWAAASLSNFAGTRRPTDSRYLSTSVILLLVAVCASLPRPRLRRGGVVAVCMVLAVIAITNAGQYTPMRNQMLATSIASRAQLGALLIMRGVVPNWFSPAPPFTTGLINDVQAGVFFSAYDAYGGLPSDSVSQLRRQDEGTRELADQALARGEEIGYGFIARAPTNVSAAAPPDLQTGAARSRGGCLLLTGQSIVVVARPGTYVFSPGGRGRLLAGARRFAGTFDIALGTVPAARTATVHVPADRAPTIPWLFSVSGRGRLCA